MRNILYIIVVVLVFSWAIGFIGYNSGGIIHLLLVIAIVLVFFNIIQRRKL